MSTEPTIAPYGAWESPVTTEMLTAGALRFEGIAVDGADVYWVESRPDEAGRCAAMRLTADGATTELTTPAHNARTRVHEYGGGALAVSNGVAYFSNFSDQRLYRRPVDGSEAPAPPGMRAGGAVWFEGIAVDGADVYWVESRPDEAGRCAPMRLTA
ncbi:MAG: S9 family peptidase, partial [Acidobacteria bacterium]|nr:S9 family peptidase [Acidobacteriota bacterium]